MSTLASNQVVGGYRVDKLIGRGGMGEIYLARQMTVDRDVALKVLSPELAQKHPQFAEQFISEARAAGRFNHPNIIAVHDVGKFELDDGQVIHYFSMEYVDGDNFHTIVKRNGKVPLEHLQLVMEAITSALVYAGEIGMVHRDIKPDNIMISRDGRVKLADFGLAMDSEDEEAEEAEDSNEEDGKKKKKRVLGTPHYMSPEQARGRPLDPRSDLYSLGATCFHMLTGEPPYDGDKRTVMRAHIREPIPDPRDRWSECPAGWAEVIMQLMEKEPADRFQSAKALLQAIKNVNEYTSQSKTRRPRTAGRGNRKAKPAWLPMAQAGAILGIVIIAAIVALSMFGGNKSETPTNGPDTTTGSPTPGDNDSSQVSDPSGTTTPSVGSGDALPNEAEQARLQAEAFIAGLPKRPKLAIEALQGKYGLQNPTFQKHSEASELLSEKLAALQAQQAANADNAQAALATIRQAVQDSINRNQFQAAVTMARGDTGRFRRGHPESVAEIVELARTAYQGAISQFTTRIEQATSVAALDEINNEINQADLAPADIRSLKQTLQNQRSLTAAAEDAAKAAAEAQRQAALVSAREDLIRALGTPKGDAPDWSAWERALGNWQANSDAASDLAHIKELENLPALIKTLGDNLNETLKAKPYSWEERGATMQAKGWDDRGRILVSLSFGRGDQGGEAPTPLRTLPLEDICEAAWKYAKLPNGLTHESAAAIIGAAWQLDNADLGQIPDPLQAALRVIFNRELAPAEAANAAGDVDNAAAGGAAAPANLGANVVIASGTWGDEESPQGKISTSAPGLNRIQSRRGYLRWRSDEMNEKKFSNFTPPYCLFEDITVQPGQKLLVRLVTDQRYTPAVGLATGRSFTGISINLGEQGSIQCVQTDRNGGIYPVNTHRDINSEARQTRIAITYEVDGKITVTTEGPKTIEWTAPSKMKGPLNPKVLNLNQSGRFYLYLYELAVVKADEGFEVFQTEDE